MLNIGQEVSDEAVWLDFDDNISLLIGRAGSVNYLKAKERLEKPFRKQIDRGKFPAEKRQNMELEAIANSILLDWKGIEQDGEPFPFTVENAVMAMKKYPAFFSFVVDASIDDDNFEVKRTEAIVKKLPKRSTGK